MKKGQSGQSSAPTNTNETILNKQYDSQLNISEENNDDRDNYSSNYHIYETNAPDFKDSPKKDDSAGGIYSKNLNDDSARPKCDCLTPLRRILNSPDFLNPDCAHSHKNLHIGTQNVSIDAGPPPPPPEGREDLWDLQFCRWWGWNWVKRRDVASGPGATLSVTRQNNFKSTRAQFQNNIEHRDCQCQYMTPNYQQQNQRKIHSADDEFPVTRRRVCVRGSCGGGGGADAGAGNSFANHFLNSLCISNRRSYDYSHQRSVNTVPSNKNSFSPALISDNFCMDCLAFLCGPDPYVGDHHRQRQSRFVNRGQIRRQPSFDSIINGGCRGNQQFNANSWLVPKNSCSSECIREPINSTGAMIPHGYNNTDDYLDYFNARMQQCCGGCGGGGCCCQCCCCCCSCDDILHKELKKKTPINCMTQTRRREKCAVTQTKATHYCDGYQSKPTTREGIISLPPKPPFRRICHMRCCCCCCRRRRRCCCCCRCSSTCKNSNSKSNLKKQINTLSKKSPTDSDKNAKKVIKDKQKNTKKKVDKSTVHFLKYLPLIDGLLLNYNRDKKFLNHNSTIDNILFNKTNHRSNKFNLFKKRSNPYLLDEYKSNCSESSVIRKKENKAQRHTTFRDSSMDTKFLDPLQSLNCFKSIQNSNQSDIEHKFLLSAVGDALMNTSKNNTNKKQEFQKIVNKDISLDLNIKLANLNDTLYTHIKDRKFKENIAAFNSESEGEEEDNKNDYQTLYSLLSLDNLFLQNSCADLKKTYQFESLQNNFNEKIKTSPMEISNAFDFSPNNDNSRREFLEINSEIARNISKEHDEKTFKKIVKDFTLPATNENTKFDVKQSKKNLLQCEAIDLSKANSSQTSLSSSINKTKKNDQLCINQTEKVSQYKKESPTSSNQYISSPTFTKTGLLPMLNADYFRKSIKRIPFSDTPSSSIQATPSKKRPRQNSDTNCAANSNPNLSLLYNIVQPTYKDKKNLVKRL